MVILVVGKGGVGKSTLSQALARYFVSHQGKQTLLIDADPDGTSSIIFQAPAHQTVAELKEELKEERSKQRPDLSGLVVMTPSGVQLLCIGHGEAAGCYCGPNGRLKAGLDELLQRYDYTVVDSHAGSEFISRGVVTPDLILVVAGGRQGDPSRFVAKQLHQILTDRGVPGRRLDVLVSDEDELGMVRIPQLSLQSAWLEPKDVDSLALPILDALNQRQ